MKKVVIIGNSKYSELLCEYIEEENILVDAFCCDKEYINKEVISGKKVISHEEFIDNYDITTILYLGIGYGNRGKNRQSMYERYIGLGYKFSNFVHHTACIDKTVEIGMGNNIFENVVIQKHCRLGNGNLLFSNCNIMHEDDIGNFNTFAAGSVCNGIVTMGNCNFIGANSIVRDKIRIGNYNIVGAGSFLYKGIDDNYIVKPERSIINTILVEPKL